jgi:hypothetical protein
MANPIERQQAAENRAQDHSQRLAVGGYQLLNGSAGKPGVRNDPRIDDLKPTAELGSRAAASTSARCRCSPSSAQRRRA